MDGQDTYTGVKDGGCNNEIVYSASTNKGASFSGTTIEPRQLPVVTDKGEQARTDQFWQGATMSARGALVVSYYDRSYYGQHNATGFSDITLSAQHARDGRDRRDRQGGFKHRRVTSASMPPPSQFAGQFIGDYAGLDVARGKAYPIWTDTRAVNEFLCPGPSTGTGDARRHQRAYPPNEGRGTAYSTTWNSTLLLALNRQDRPGRDRARGGSVLSVLKVSPTRQI